MIGFEFLFLFFFLISFGCFMWTVKCYGFIEKMIISLDQLELFHLMFSNLMKEQRWQSPDLDIEYLDVKLVGSVLTKCHVPKYQYGMNEILWN